MQCMYTGIDAATCLNICAPAIMANPKGLSFAEKINRMLKAMTTSDTFFSMKELELVGKKCGIVPQTIKDVVQHILDNDLCLSDKVGVSTIYWALSSDAMKLIKNQQRCLTAKSKELDKTLENLSAEIEKTKQEMSGKRDISSVKKENKDLEHELSLLNREIQQAEKKDPLRIQLTRTEIEKSETDIEKWEENLEILISYMTKKLNCSRQEFINNFNIDQV